MTSWQDNQRKRTVRARTGSKPIAVAAGLVRRHDLATLYQQRLAKLHEAMRADDTGAEVLELLRGLIDRVTVSAAAEGGGMEIELTGDIAAMISLASGEGPVRRPVGADPGLFLSSVKMVAGTRNHLDLLLTG